MLVEALEDEAMTPESHGVKPCISCASDLLLHMDSPSIDDKVFVGWLVELLIDIVSEKLDGAKFWSEFHKQRSSKEFSTKWESYLDKIQFKKRAYILPAFCLETI